MSSSDGVAADVVDGAVVAARVVGRIERRDSRRAAVRARGCVSQTTGGAPPASDREAREQAAEHAVADDEIGRRSCAGVRAGDGVVGGRGQRQQTPPARRAVRRSGSTRAPGTTTRDAAPPNRPRTSPKQRAPGTKTRSPTSTARLRRRPRRRGRPTRSRAPADSPCPGKCGMRPDQSSRSVPVLMPLHSMSTTTSSSPGGRELEPAQSQALGFLEHDGEGVHSANSVVMRAF